MLIKETAGTGIRPNRDGRSKTCIVKNAAGSFRNNPMKKILALLLVLALIPVCAAAELTAWFLDVG